MLRGIFKRAQMLMDLSIFLAKAMGLYIAIACLAILINRKPLDKVFKSYAKDIGMVFFHGAMALILGLILVLNHNIWTMDWVGLVTLLGWITLLKGVARMFLPEKAIQTGLSIYNSASTLFLIIGLVLGIYLAYMGFTA